MQQMNPRTKSILQSSVVPALVIGCAAVALATSPTAHDVLSSWMRKLGLGGVATLDRPEGLSAHLDVFSRALADPNLSESDRIGAAEVLRLEAVVPGANDAARFAERILTEFATLLDRDPQAHAARMCAIDAARAVAVGVESEGTYAADVLSSWLENGMAIEPENGIYSLFAAEAALKYGRIEEAIDLLTRAAEAEVVDPHLWKRRALALECLVAHGVLRVSADDHLTREAYARPANGPGDALQTISHVLGRRLTEGRDSSAREWSTLYASIQRIGVKVASRTLLVEDAHDALTSADGFLSELDTSLIGGSNRGDTARRRAAEAALRESGYGERLIAMRRDSDIAAQFIQSALRQSAESSTALERTARADLLVRSLSVLPIWILAFAWVAIGSSWIGRRRDPDDKRFAPDPVLRMAAFLAPAFLLLVWIGEGLAPFDGGRGVEGLLYSFARPTAPLLALPLAGALLYAVRVIVEARLLREPWRTIARVRARSLALTSLLAIQILLVIAAVMARSTDGVVRWRERGLDALRVEHYSAQVAVLQNLF